MNVRPFQISVPEAELVALRDRIKATRWPDRETVADHSQGVPLALIAGLAQYWAADYDWRACEKTLNALPQFVAEIDGIDVHFIHVKSKHTDALPMVMAHGWPGSILEFLQTIGPLTDPTAYGGNAGDAFHLVIPSMPGYGFSGKPVEPGWNVNRIARAWVALMQGLGYERFVAQGGDWGAGVAELMAKQTPPGLLVSTSTCPRAYRPTLRKHCSAALPHRPAFQPTSKRRTNSSPYFTPRSARTRS